MTTLAQIRRAITKHGAELTIQDAGDARTLNIDLPAGMRWVVNGCHALAGHFRPGESKGWASDVYTDMLERMEYGTEVCTDTECDICYPVE